MMLPHRLFPLAGPAIALALLLSAPGLSLAQGGEGGNDDYRTFHVGGKIEYGKIGDSYTAELVMYLAGNQFMVMEELVQAFQRKHPEIKTVYVETIPPGQILAQQILKQGQINGQDTARNPDLYASVSYEHVKRLKKEGLMDEAMYYIHNKLELMVARGNPKRITGPRDLGRDDLVQSHPNPVNQGIFTFYGAEMLKMLGLWEKVTGGGKQCFGCWAVPETVWFTARHHRETPDRIEKGEADVGIVWATEIAEAKKENRKVEGVTIPAPYDFAKEAVYVIGGLKTGRNSANGRKFLDYLAGDAAQDIYAKYGFVKATPDERKLKPIP